MKKNFIYLLLLCSLIAQAQITPSYPTIKLTKTVEGVKQDSLLVLGTDKIVKHIPYSKISNVHEYATASALPVTGVAGKLYITKDNNKIYTWNGTFYTELAVVDISGKVDKIAGKGLSTEDYSTADKTKLDGIATGATANQTDAYLLNRANHTGTQAISTVTGLQTTLDSKVDKVAGERLINASEITKLANQSGTNTGDQDLSNLVVKNTPITGATNTKITYDSKGLVTGGASLLASDIPTLNQNTTGTASTITGSISQSQVTNLVTDLSNKQSISSKGVAGGYASLDGSGKVPLSQINDVLLGSVNYQGIYNASTNTPTLPVVSSSNKGFYFVVSTAGTQQGLTLNSGDWIISNGTAWGKIDNNNAVTAVNNLTGNVTLTSSNIAEGSNMYYTEARVNANTNVAANTAARHNAVTIGTANGLSLSTQALSLGLASTSATGALSSTDWNTFNNKVTNATHTGDVTGSTALTLATVNSNVGMFGNASNVAKTTVNAKGLTTAVSNVPIQIAESQVTNLVSDLSGKEPAFSKNTAFNKNFGTTAGTVAEGNDSRILNGQTAFGWGNHAEYNGFYNSLGAGYLGGGLEKPNWYGFGSGKLKLQMLSGGNLGAPDLYSDVLWMSSYTGSDVKGSNALIFSKYSDRVGFVRQDYDAANWGTYREFMHTGNFNSYSPTLIGTGASGTWSINISGNATTAGGLGVHNTSLNNDANKIVRTDNNGYIQAGWINTVSGNNGTEGITRIYASNDQYLRYYTPENFISTLGLATTSTNRWYDGWVNAPGYDANTIGGSKSGFTYSNNAPFSGPLVHFEAGGYGIQLNSNYSGVQDIRFRTRNGDAGTWNPWTIFLTGNNYNVYSPSLIGTGASGNWNINANTATTLQNPRTINGVSFNGSANITIPSTDSRPYKVYSALYSQNDTSNPTVIILENTLGTVTFARSSNGVYFVNSSGLFTTDKTFVMMGAGTNAAYTNAINLINSSTFSIVTKVSSTQADADSANTKVAFEIRVYN